MEVWKSITDYADYEVSNFGNIKRKNRILKPHHGRYSSIGLYKNKYDRKTFNVHVLVAQEFIGPRPEGLVIDHIDHNTNNNNVTNLRYCTQSVNVLTATRTSLGGVCFKNDHERKKPYYACIHINKKKNSKHFATEAEGYAWLQTFNHILTSNNLS